MAINRGHLRQFLLNINPIGADRDVVEYMATIGVVLLRSVCGGRMDVVR